MWGGVSVGGAGVRWGMGEGAGCGAWEGHHFKQSQLAGALLSPHPHRRPQAHPPAIPPPTRPPGPRPYLWGSVAVLYSSMKSRNISFSSARGMASMSMRFTSCAHAWNSGRLAYWSVSRIRPYLPYS